MKNLKVSFMFIVVILLSVALISGCFYVPKLPAETTDDIEEYQEAIEKLEQKVEDLSEDLETEQEEDEEVPVVRDREEETSETEPRVIESEPEEEISDEAQDLFAGNSKLKSISYNYRAGSRVDLPTYDVYLKGDKMKILMPTDVMVLNTVEMDMIIIDWDEMTATSYCASEKYCIETGEQGEISFDEYYVMNPLVWVDGVDSAEKVGEERLYNRDVTLVDVNNGEYEYSVEDYFGIPLEIRKSDEVVAVFADPVFNSVSDEDMEFAVTE